MAEHRHRCEVAIVGAGPAGLSAARAAAAHGARVLLIDPQPAPGGQIWRHDVRHGAPALARALRAGLEAAGVPMLLQSEVVGCAGRRLFVRSGAQAAQVDYDRLVLATGARELLLPFPGWTLPGVTGAGGAQALAKQGWPVRGRRVVVAGSGPLLLAAAATLRRHGARVLGIHEQAPARALAAFAAGLWRWPGKALQALRLRAALAGVPYRAGSHVLRALGDGRLRAVELRVGARTLTLDCDQLACGFGLVPNIELAHALGCALDHAGGRHAQVAVDDWQRTSVEEVYAAGEACGIGGVDCATVEGAIAGHAAAGRRQAARALLPARARARRFAAGLRRHFALHDGLRTLADADTLICRCEDVPLSALAGLAPGREARLMTRCGMGACQGRVCGSALAELGGAARGGLRPPIFPVPLEVLAGFGHDLPADPPQESLK
ncbi:FAD-dependent oxidoreductase [Pseudoxanthomonas mexicana]|uniref:FAD-dependent oxidoreductase n=1 Tax=Pseudoxanthomonas mexicana TaxID=128785 RepID=UPI00398AA8FB